MQQDHLKELAQRFFLGAYTREWFPENESEESMIRSALTALSARESLLLLGLFQSLLQKSDSDIETAFLYDFGCQTQPLTKFNQAYRHKDLRHVLDYIIEIIKSNSTKEPQELCFEANTLKEGNGTLVATFNESLGDKAQVYGKLFAVAADMLAFLENQIQSATQNYEIAFKDANDFNTRVEQTGRGNVYGWRDRPYPEFPEWVQEGLDLVARAKGKVIG